MKVIKDIINNIEVTYIKTNKFKTVYGSLIFLSPVKKDVVTKRSLIGSIIVNSCKKYNTNEKLNINTLENYGAEYESFFGIYGNYMINSFDFSCLNDKYIDSNVISNTIDTYKELLFNPNVLDNSFDKDTFNLCYKVFETELLTEKENIRSYCYKKLLKTLDSTKAYSYFKNLNDLNNINEKNLYEEYVNMINNSEIKLILAGDFDYKKYATSILESLKSKKYDINKFIENDNKKEEILIKKESIDCLGSVIFTGFKCFNLTNYERTYVMPIFSRILGGGATSRCFDIIREKESLAYYCYSRYDKADGILSVYAGIDKNNFDKVYNLILDIFNSMNNISDDEIKIAKKDIITGLKENNDYIKSVVNMNFFKDFYNEDEMDKKIEAFNNVTLEELKKVYLKVKADCVYFVEGKVEDEGN